MAQTTALRTTVRIYPTERAMAKDIPKWEARGWSVQSVEAQDQGWACSRTCCLGALFLPLALLGKRDPGYRVVYQHL